MVKRNQRDILLSASKKNAELMKDIVYSDTAQRNHQQDRYIDRLFWISNLILGGSVAINGLIHDPFESVLFIGILISSVISVLLGLQNYHLIDKFFEKDIKIVNKNWRNWVKANDHIFNPKKDPQSIFNKSSKIDQQINKSREEESPEWAKNCQEVTILLSSILYVILIIYKVNITTGIFKIIFDSFSELLGY